MVQQTNGRKTKRAGFKDISFVAKLRDQKEIHYYTSKRQKENCWRKAEFERVNVIWQYLCIALMVGRKPEE